LDRQDAKAGEVEGGWGFRQKVGKITEVELEKFRISGFRFWVRGFEIGRAYFVVRVD
jgi:hypothetical protein